MHSNVEMNQSNEIKFYHLLYTIYSSQNSKSKINQSSLLSLQSSLEILESFTVSHFKYFQPIFNLEKEKNWNKTREKNKKQPDNSQSNRKKKNMRRELEREL